MTTIMVVEDEVDIRESILNVLGLENFDTIEAADGKLAVQLAQNHLPDIIVCDIHLPKLSGFDVIQELAQQSLTAKIPFIFLTAQTSEEYVQKGQALGACAYLTKPFTPDTLLTTIRDCLDKV